MRVVLSFLLVICLFASCAKYDARKIEGIWRLDRVNLCTNGDCFDTLEDRGTRARFDKIELRLTESRTAEGRFYNQGVLLYKVDFEYILDEEKGKMSFIGPEDTIFPNFFGGNVYIEELNKSELVYVAIESFPNEETVYIYTRLQ